MSGGLTIFLYGLGVLAFIDAARRPSYQWVEADRRKAFWLVMLFFFNVFAAAIYVLFVLPRFPVGRGQIDSAFLKDSRQALVKREE